MASQSIQGLLDKAVAEGAAPGLSAAVSRPGEPVRTFVAGVRGVSDPAPMAPDTIFWIASCTKAITSAAALELVAQGRLDLDEPVGRLAPELAQPLVLTGFDDQGAPVMRPAARPITLRTLLSHTSGLAYDFNSAETLAWLAHHGLSLTTAGSLAFPLIFEPGDDWRYGVGIDVAGVLIERASGRSLGEHLTETLFRPLGMGDTTFDPSPEQNARRATLHARLPDGGLAPIDPIPAMPPTLRGGGGLVSTPSDYMRFLRAVLDGGAGAISPATIAHLTSPQLSGPTLGDLASVIPQVSADFRPMPGVEKGWTLGFLQNKSALPGGRAAGSLAWAGLANCYYWADPERGVAGALFGQLLPFADPQMLEVFEAFEQAVYAS